MAFSPTNNLPFDWRNTVQLTIPRYAQVNLKFSTDMAKQADNVVCIYDSSFNVIMAKSAEDGNLVAETIDRDRSDDRIIYIAGYRQNGAATQDDAWQPKPCKLKRNVADGLGSGTLIFEDEKDAQYNDLVVQYSFE